MPDTVKAGFRFFGALLFAVVSCGQAGAQAWPAKPIRMILPFPPGAPSDMVGRFVAQTLSGQVGQSIIADNRVGAGGNIGIAAVAKAAPDGYTMLVTSPSLALSPALYRTLPYDPQKDLVPVARLATIENVMLVHPSVPAKTLKEFVALARNHPGKLNYGSGGAGTTNHLANELLKNLQKINIIHVPYKGATLAAGALISGEVDQVVVSVASSLPLIQAGRVRALAVLSQQRVPMLPEVPTAQEAGIKDFFMSIWYGMFLPVGTPREITAHLGRETLRALDSAELRKRFAGAGIEPWPGTAEELAALVRTETVRFAEIVRAAGIKPQ